MLEAAIEQQYSNASLAAAQALVLRRSFFSFALLFEGAQAHLKYFSVNFIVV